MLVLYKYMPAWQMADFSPFCVKVETYLRMVGVDYEGRVGDVRKAPKRKLPYVEDGGQVVCDSRDIITHFEAKLPNALDRGLSPAQQALTTAFRALMEEEAYFLAIVLRWKEVDGWEIYRPVIQTYLRAVGVPAWMAPALSAVVRRGVVAQCDAQGSGRHTREEVEARLLQTAQAVITQFGDGPYFFGEQPHVIDASAFAFLSAALDAPFRSKAKDLLSSSPAVRDYHARLHARYFGG